MRDDVLTEARALSVSFLTNGLNVPAGRGIAWEHIFRRTSPITAWVDRMNSENVLGKATDGENSRKEVVEG